MDSEAALRGGVGGGRRGRKTREEITLCLSPNGNAFLFFLSSLLKDKHLFSNSDSYSEE